MSMPTFPFLIGTVRTEQEERALVHLKEFPFLIGTVRTDKNGKR